MTDAIKPMQIESIYARKVSPRGQVSWLALSGCIFVVALAPLPLGSARPATWIGWAMVVGLLTILHAGGKLLAGSGLVAWPRWVVLVGVLFGLLCAMLVVQLLPLGALSEHFGFVGAQGVRFVSGTLSLDQGSTALMLMRMVTFGLFFLLVAEASCSSRAARTLLRSLLVIVTIYALMGLFFLSQGDTFMGMEKWAYIGSATASFVNRNSFATFLSFGLALGVAQLASELRGMSREGAVVTLRTILRSRAAYIAAAILIIIAALIATQSRMGVVSGVVGVGVVLTATSVHWRPTRAAALIAILATALVVGLLAIGFGDGLMDRLGSLDADADGRFALYQQVAGMVMHRPWTGFGGGSFELAYPVFHQLPVSPDVSWEKAHSSYLSLWAEMGVVAGTLPLLIYGLLTVQAMRLLFAKKGQGLVAISALGCIAVAATHSLVDFSLEIQANTFMLLAVMALLPSTAIRYENYEAR